MGERASQLYHSSTSSLPLLHSLLRAVHIPILPSTLSATSPSLLLLILETLLATRLSIPPSIRPCSRPSDEIAVIKCILGVLAHDILGMDLTIIDPVRVVQGREQELAVVIMALTVVAKRSGVRLSIPNLEEQDKGVMDWEDGGAGEEDLPTPIQPDMSYPSSGPLSPSPKSTQDVFSSTHERPVSTSDLLFNRGRTNEADLRHQRSMGRRSPFLDRYPLDYLFGTLHPYITPELTMPGPPFAGIRKDEREASKDSTRTRSSGSPVSQTVLQHMEEEFGLGSG